MEILFNKFVTDFDTFVEGVYVLKAKKEDLSVLNIDLLLHSMERAEISLRTVRAKAVKEEIKDEEERTGKKASTGFLSSLFAKVKGS